MAAEAAPFKVSSLSGKVALVTGASSGIGASTSILFAKLGVKLALNGRDVENLIKTAKQCKDAGQHEPLLVPGDLTDEDTVKKTIEKTIDHYGRLDVLVNSAGILVMGSIETTNMEQYDRVMNTNVRSVYHLTHLAVPHRINSKGCIVNVSSVNGQRSFLEKCKETDALGRPGEVDEVAQAIAFLSSDAASFITGVNLPVAVGRHAMCPR
ncbi:UNVERIFIED_CONTAM: hypothetical protein FKN15_015124 [Acipenser sinensis]